MKQQQNMKQPNMTFYLIVACFGKPTTMTRPAAQGAKRATDRQEIAARIRRRLAEGATYCSIQHELHVSPVTISKIKKQMQE